MRKRSMSCRRRINEILLEISNSRFAILYLCDSNRLLTLFGGHRISHHDSLALRSSRTTPHHFSRIFGARAPFQRTTSSTTQFSQSLTLVRHRLDLARRIIPPRIGVRKSKKCLRPSLWLRRDDTLLLDRRRRRSRQSLRLNLPVRARRQSRGNEKSRIVAKRSE